MWTEITRKERDLLRFEATTDGEWKVRSRCCLAAKR